MSKQNATDEATGYMEKQVLFFILKDTAYIDRIFKRDKIPVYYFANKWVQYIVKGALKYYELYQSRFVENEFLLWIRGMEASKQINHYEHVAMLNLFEEVAGIPGYSEDLSDDQFNRVYKTWLGNYAAKQIKDEIAKQINVINSGRGYDALAALSKSFETIINPDRMHKNSVVSYSFLELKSLPRTKLRYIIDDLLPWQGKLCMSMGPKVGKTLWLEEVGFCAACGHVDFLGMHFNDPVRVGFLNPELSDQQIIERTLDKILPTAPEWLDVNRAMDNFFYFVNAENGRPNLTSPEGVNRVREFIEKHQIQLLLCDSLYMLFPGLDENSASSMTMALDTLAKLSLDYNLSLIVTHHHNKTNTAARGSSVWDGWGDSVLSGRFVDERHPTIIEVRGILRNASRTKWFPAYWECILDETNFWLSEMPKGWTPPAVKAGRPPIKSVDTTIEKIIADHGGHLSYKKIINCIIEKMNVSKSTAERRLKEAKEQGRLSCKMGSYTIAGQESEDEEEMAIDAIATSNCALEAILSKN